LVNATSSYAVTSNNNTFTGTQTFNNIAVNGTASVAYLQSVTGSAKIIGDAFIILNNDTPTLRYAGIKVQDSGSTNTTASIQWDGGTDDWFVEKDISGTTEYGVVTLGPEYTTIGTPTYNTNNTLVMSNGGHHLNDSPVSVSASVVTITGQVSASSYIGDGSGLTGISTSPFPYTGSAGIQGNLDMNSGGKLVISDWTGSLHETSILIGQTSNNTNLVNILGENNVQIGYNSRIVESSTRNNVVLVGSNSQTAQGCVLVGNNSNALVADGIVIGNSLTLSQNNEINIGGKFKYDGVNKIRLEGNLDVSGSIVVSGSGITFSDGTTQTTAAGGGSAGLVAGTGTDSMKSSDTLTTNPATASGDRSIAIGNGASATANDGINIGDKFKYDGSNTIRFDSNGMLFNSSGTLGASSNAINLGIEGGSVTGNYSSNFGCTYGTISTGDSTLVGGYNNTISAGATNLIVGGEANQITNGNYSQIFGGASNTLSAGDTSFILGGYQNQVTAGIRNGVIGGNQAISAHDFSVVIGRQSYTTAAAYTTYVASLDVSGSTVLSGSVESTGNFEVGGQVFSPTFAGTIASSTSSIDFDNGNFATLSASAATYVANPTNLKSGTTYTVIVTNGANISGYGTSFKFAGGTQPTLSAGTDILTMVSDGTNLYATGLADFQ
jgi:hypothetical protein